MPQDAHWAQSKTVEHYTPPEIIEIARKAMGGISLDPASDEAGNRTVRADRYFTVNDDGLTKPWDGSVWLNPPFGKIKGKSSVGVWAAYLSDQYRFGGVWAFTFLCNTRHLEHAGVQELLYEASSAMCIMRGRLEFMDAHGVPQGAPTASSVLIFGSLAGGDTSCFLDGTRDLGLVVAPVRRSLRR